MGGTTYFSGIKFMQLKGGETLLMFPLVLHFTVFSDGIYGNEEKPG
jgi:hypothetical protein